MVKDAVCRRSLLATVVQPESLPESPGRIQQREAAAKVSSMFPSVLLTCIVLQYQQRFAAFNRKLGSVTRRYCA